MKTWTRIYNSVCISRHEVSDLTNREHVIQFCGSDTKRLPQDSSNNSAAHLQTHDRHEPVKVHIKQGRYQSSA